MKFKFEIYHRTFKQPLRTSHGIWREREGIIISLEDATGKIALGEIAPLPWFGSETMTQAVNFCQGLAFNISAAEIRSIPDCLPACQFAFGTALMALVESAKSSKLIDSPAAQNRELGSNNIDSHKNNLQSNDLSYCYLLPGGEAVLTSWQKIYQTHHNSTFKWKIGVYPLAAEIKILRQLIQDLPAQVKLRLDANGGLDLAQAKSLLAIIDQLNVDNLDTVEFVEQPLPPQQLAQTFQLSREYQTPLALDESVASFMQLQRVCEQGWSGIFVIKAAIMGSPCRLLRYCQSNSLDVVFSSVLETEVGRQSALNLVQQLSHPRAVGFGVDYFA